MHIYYLFANNLFFSLIAEVSDFVASSKSKLLTLPFGGNASSEISSSQ